MLTARNPRRHAIQVPATSDSTLARFTNWVFTINNFTEEEVQGVKDLEEDERIKTLICGRETGEQGTPHLQGFFGLHSRQYRTNVIRMFPVFTRAYLAGAKGSLRDNYIYCTKQHDVIASKGMSDPEMNKKLTGGADWQMIMTELSRCNRSQFEMMFPKFYFMHQEQCDRRLIKAENARASPWGGCLSDKNYWIYGQTGTGKSRWAMAQGNMANTLRKNFNKWWDGYDVEETRLVIIDDWPNNPQGNTLAYHIKIWGDRYPFEGEVKGSHVFTIPGRFFLIITSNYPIAECFTSPSDIEAIKRRFKEIKFTAQNAPLLSQARVDYRILDDFDENRDPLFHEDPGFISASEQEDED